MKFTAEQALETAAKVCERMRPHGGRAFSDEQMACFDALTDAAKNIREFKERFKWVEEYVE